MTLWQIPIASAESHFAQENDVFGHTFILEFEWVEREGYWMLHLFDAVRFALAMGVKVQPDWPLYVHHLKSGSIAFMLVATSLGQTLSRHTLRQHFTLVACETF